MLRLVQNKEQNKEEPIYPKTEFFIQTKLIDYFQRSVYF